MLTDQFRYDNASLFEKLTLNFVIIELNLRTTLGFVLRLRLKVGERIPLRTPLRVVHHGVGDGLPKYVSRVNVRYFHWWLDFTPLSTTEVYR